MADPYNPQQLSSFQDAASRTDAQRRALLDAVASGGQAGAQAYQQAQAQAQQARMDALAGASQAAQNSPLSLVQGGLAALERPVQQDAALRQADLSQAQQTLQNDLARQQASGEQFFSRMQQAIPITEARTRMGVEQIIREQQEAEAQRALEMQLAQLDLQSRRESIAAQREERAFQQRAREQELKQQQAAAKGGGLDPIEKEQLKALQRENKTAVEDAAFTNAAGTIAGGAIDANGNPTPAGAAFQAIVNGGNPKLSGFDARTRSSIAAAAEAYFRAIGEPATVDDSPFSRNRVQRQSGTNNGSGFSKPSAAGPIGAFGRF